MTPFRSEAGGAPPRRNGCCPHLRVLRTVLSYHTPAQQINPERPVCAILLRAGEDDPKQ